VLEWRLDPTSPHRHPVAGDPERRVVIVCDEGYSSSLAAHTLQQLGLANATDLRGGYQAWLATGRRTQRCRGATCSGWEGSVLPGELAGDHAP
jgi:rhodanese-related sulfurtransferase